VLSHELGHGFGMQHAFEQGVGRTGGIMDYGNPMINGAAQFHPVYNQPEVCSFITGLKNQQSQCRYLKSDSTPLTGTNCGDGILSKSEECECLNESVSCPKCVNCKAAAGVQCSSAQFVLRTPSTPDTVVVSSSALGNGDCCVNNKFAKPKSTCSKGKNVCGAAGECVPVCTKILGSTVSSCGFDSSGCLQGCVWDDKCRFDMVYGSDNALVSAVPDGAPCNLGKSIGKCVNAKCVSPKGGAADLFQQPELVKHNRQLQDAEK